jgi:hypothetical protein
MAKFWEGNLVDPLKKWAAGHWAAPGLVGIGVTRYAEFEYHSFIIIASVIADLNAEAGII